MLPPVHRAGGFGYGDNDDVTIVPNADCIFLRKEFDVAATEDYGYLSLGIDYDDGFIAFLNGIEIARSSNMAGVAGVAEILPLRTSKRCCTAAVSPNSGLVCRRIRALAGRGHQRVFGSSAQLQRRVID